MNVTARPVGFSGVRLADTRAMSAQPGPAELSTGGDRSPHLRRGKARLDLKALWIGASCAVKRCSAGESAITGSRNWPKEYVVLLCRGDEKTIACFADSRAFDASLDVGVPNTGDGAPLWQHELGAKPLADGDVVTSVNNTFFKFVDGSQCAIIRVEGAADDLLAVIDSPPETSAQEPKRASVVGVLPPCWSAWADRYALGIDADTIARLDKDEPVHSLVTYSEPDLRELASEEFGDEKIDVIVEAVAELRADNVAAEDTAERTKSVPVACAAPVSVGEKSVADKVVVAVIGPDLDALAVKVDARLRAAGTRAAGHVEIQKHTTYANSTVSGLKEWLLNTKAVTAIVVAITRDTLLGSPRNMKLILQHLVSLRQGIGAKIFSSSLCVICTDWDLSYKAEKQRRHGDGMTSETFRQKVEETFATKSIDVAELWLIDLASPEDSEQQMDIAFRWLQEHAKTALSENGTYDQLQAKHDRHMTDLLEVIPKDTMLECSLKFEHGKPYVAAEEKGARVPAKIEVHGLERKLVETFVFKHQSVSLGSLIGDISVLAGHAIDQLEVNKPVKTIGLFMRTGAFVLVSVKPLPL